MGSAQYASCAKVEDGVVTNVIACRNATWATTKLGGLWIPVYAENPCGIGYTWDGETFSPPSIDEDMISTEGNLDDIPF